MIEFNIYRNTSYNVIHVSKFYISQTEFQNILHQGFQKFKNTLK